MSDSTNPYTPPRAHEAPPDPGIPAPQGDLERALSGDHRLQAGPTIREAWQRVSGSKAGILGPVILLWGLSTVAAAAAWVVVIGLLEPAAFREVAAVFMVMSELSSQPAGVALGLILSPMAALLYLGVWNLGMRRAVNLPLGIGAAFPLSAMLPATAITAALSITGAVQLISPYLGYLTTVPLLFLGWTFPLLLDRRCSTLDAVRWSVTLTFRNLLPVLAMAALSIGLYIGVAITLGVGLIWWIPFSVCLCGVSYRRLCGVQGP